MDELSFRFHELMENVQVRINMATDTGLRIVRQYSDEARALSARVIHQDSVNSLRISANSAWHTIVEFLERVREAIRSVDGPNVFMTQMQIIFQDEIARNNVYFVLVGMSVGTAGGLILGAYLFRPTIANPIMKSIACLSFKGTDNVTLCKTNLPRLTSTSDILIRVRAASINRLDYKISQGYGRTLRGILQGYNKYNKELPLIIARSCSGVVESVGKDAQCGLEIGDEVWLASHFYEVGLASQLVVAHESRVGRKPFMIGFEGAASLPYDGCVALTALKKANLRENTSLGKKVLIEDGCSPVGCVLTQLLKKWGAHVTATCHTRSAPVVNALGADDIITFNNECFEVNFIERNIEQSTFLNELVARGERFDVVFFTTRSAYDKKFIKKFLNEGAVVIDTSEKPLRSDHYGSVMKLFYYFYVNIKKFAARTFQFEPNWADEPHLCHLNLDILSNYVNDETLNTVVDQVYNPQEAERALTHVVSEKRIGSTIVTFR